MGGISADVYHTNVCGGADLFRANNHRCSSDNCCTDLHCANVCGCAPLRCASGNCHASSSSSPVHTANNFCCPSSSNVCAANVYAANIHAANVYATNSYAANVADCEFDGLHAANANLHAANDLHSFHGRHAHGDHSHGDHSHGDYADH